MKNKINGLWNVLVKDKNSDGEPEKRSTFNYILLEEEFPISFDVKGHCTIDEAFEIAKDKFSSVIVKYGLKEAIDAIDIDGDDLRLLKVNTVKELKELIFNEDILNFKSELFSNFKQVLIKHWCNELEAIFYVCDNVGTILVHDDRDKKTLKNHYFESLDEFKNNMSFLEYVNSIVVPESLIRNGFSQQMRKGYSNILPDYYLMDDTISRDKLQDFLNKSGVSLDVINGRQSVSWAAFGYYYGITHGLSDSESKSFATILNKEFASFNIRNIDLGVDKYYKVDLIEKIILSIEFDDEPVEEKMKVIFCVLFDLYKNRIEEFEYKNNRLEFRVSKRQYDQFMALTGKTKADKLDFLMRNYISMQNLDIDESDNLISKDMNVNIDDLLTKVNEDSLSGYLSEKFGSDKEITRVNYEGGYVSPMMKEFNEELIEESEQWKENKEALEKQTELKNENKTEKQALENRIEDLYQEYKKLNEDGDFQNAEEKFDEMLMLMEESRRNKQ